MLPKYLSTMVYDALLAETKTDMRKALDILDTYYYSYDIDYDGQVEYTRLRLILYSAILLNKDEQDFTDVLHKVKGIKQ
jgi:hypothetical protein